jgi:hypothetical protein
MSYYIDNTPFGRAPVVGKATWILATIPGAALLPTAQPTTWQPNLVCVVENGPFDAAGFAFDPNEMAAFLYSNPSHPDRRRKRWLVVPDAFKLATHGWQGGPKFCPSCDGRLEVTDAKPLGPTEYACSCDYRPVSNHVGA